MIENKIAARVDIWSDALTAQEISAVLNLPFVFVRSIGELPSPNRFAPIPSTLPYNRTHCGFHAPSEMDEFETQLEYLLGTLEEHRAAVESLVARGARVQFSITIVLAGSNDRVHLTHSQIKRMSELGCAAMFGVSLA